MKERADVLLTERGLAESREKARSLIMAGQVYLGGCRVEKPGERVETDAVMEVRGGEEFVSRGGKKLARAIEVFGIRLAGLVCADIGASTGGFTDCMLQNGAARVYAIDVGYGQLAWKLREDKRVVNIERTNIRYITPAQLPEPLDFFSVDVSFISLKLVLPAVAPFLAADAGGVCLIKPQFEAGREWVGKNGVVRREEGHIEAIERVLAILSDCGLVVRGLTYSPIKGPKGNIEYLVYAARGGQAAGIDSRAMVREANAKL